jgi:hypothetical protein
MVNFLRVPLRLESFLTLGHTVAADLFLFQFTWLPLRFVYSLWLGARALAAGTWCVGSAVGTREQRRMHVASLASVSPQLPGAADSSLPPMPAFIPPAPPRAVCASARRHHRPPRQPAAEARFPAPRPPPSVVQPLPLPLPLAPHHPLPLPCLAPPTCTTCSRAASSSPPRSS